jgi:two-component system, NtrC family, C4-dicarboxylate transport sensor histidine kinase DctB
MGMIMAGSDDALIIPGWTEGLPSEVLRQIEKLLEEIAANKKNDNASRSLIIQLGKMAELGIQCASMIHELKQPLAGIRSFTQMIREKHENLSTEQISWLELVIDQTAKMDNILENVRQYSRLEGDNIRQVRLGEALETVRNLMSKQLENTGVVLELQLSDGMIAVSAPDNGLHQILINLIRNSLDAIKGNGRIIIKAWIEKDVCKIGVADNGPGIPTEISEDIFEYFFTTKPRATGTGLGLAICNEILGRVGSRLELVKSAELDEGISTEFRFELPLAREAKRSA